MLSLTPRVQYIPETYFDTSLDDRSHIWAVKSKMKNDPKVLSAMEKHASSI